MLANSDRENTKCFRRNIIGCPTCMKIWSAGSFDKRNLSRNSFRWKRNGNRVTFGSRYKEEMPMMLEGSCPLKLLPLSFEKSPVIEIELYCWHSLLVTHSRHAKTKKKKKRKKEIKRTQGQNRDPQSAIHNAFPFVRKEIYFENILSRSRWEAYPTRYSSNVLDKTFCCVRYVIKSCRRKRTIIHGVLNVFKVIF